MNATLLKYEEFAQRGRELASRRETLDESEPFPLEFLDLAREIWDFAKANPADPMLAATRFYTEFIMMLNATVGTIIMDQHNGRYHKAQ